MSKQSRLTYPKRGDIYVVNFDPTIGSEIRKIRPALILQNDISNQYSPITIVAAISSQFGEKLYPTEVFIPAQEGGLKTNSVVLLNQIRSIDRKRLTRRIGVLKPGIMVHVDKALKISLGLIDL